MKHYYGAASVTVYSRP